MSNNTKNLMRIVLLIAVSAFLYLGCGTSDDGDGGPGGSVGGYAGNYEGTWGIEGLIVGNWTATVDSSGNVTGSGDDGDFTIAGSVSGTGAITFTGTTQDSGATTATFVGSINASGHVQGTWTSTSGDSGTFTGDRVTS